MNEFNENVREIFSAAGNIVIKSMMGGYLVYLNGKLIGDICGNELFLKRTPTSNRLLADSELRYPYEGSKTLMHVFDKFEDKDLNRLGDYAARLKVQAELKRYIEVLI